MNTMMNLRERYDVAIVGGGLAGSALAALLARQDRDVALLEKDAFPRYKLCGEFLSTESRSLLAEIGCLDRVLEARPAVIRSSRFVAPSGRAVELPLPGVGLGLRRWVLDHILFEHARSCGADTATRTEVREIVERASTDSCETTALRLRAAENEERQIAAAAVVLAHGRRDRLDRQLERPFLRRPTRWAGFQRHCVSISTAAGERLRKRLDGVVEVHGFDGGYCGLMFVDGGRINVCGFLDERHLKGASPNDWSALEAFLSKANPELALRLDDLAPKGDPARSVARVPLVNKEPTVGQLLCLGDAAGMVAPMCGDGQATALRSAVLLAEVFNGAPAALENGAVDAIAHAWSVAWHREFARRMRLGRWLQAILVRPRWADLSVRIVRLLPPVGRLLVRATRARSSAPASKSRANVQPDQ